MAAKKDAALHLVQLPSGWIFLFGRAYNTAQPIKLHNAPSLFFETRAAGVECAAACGIKVDARGKCSAEGPNPYDPPKV